MEKEDFLLENIINVATFCFVAEPKMPQNPSHNFHAISSKVMGPQALEKSHDLSSPNFKTIMAGQPTRNVPPRNTEIRVY